MYVSAVLSWAIFGSLAATKATEGLVFWGEHPTEWPFGVIRFLLCFWGHSKTHIMTLYIHICLRMSGDASR